PDPTGDDNGPGTYQYPTSGDFRPGAFDLTGMTINEDANNVYLQVGIQNLASTFSSSFGAQLLDFCVRNPSASSFSSAAAFPSPRARSRSASAPPAAPPRSARWTPGRWRR